MEEFPITANEANKYKNSTKAKFSSATEERDWARTQEKQCSKCKEKLPVSCFNGNTSGADPFDKNGYRLRRPECRSCSQKTAKGKAAARRKANTQKPPPGTTCEICMSDQNIVFDHDHVTNTFRGWLCNPCNRAMGVFMDSEEGLQRAINYLQKPRPAHPEYVS